MEQLLSKILEKIKKDAYLFQTWEDLLYMCKEAMKTDISLGVRYLKLLSAECERGISDPLTSEQEVKELYGLHKRVLLAAAPYDFDSYLLYVEWNINDFYDTTRPYMRRWANDAAAAYKAALDSNSPSKRFMRIGEDTVLGYNLGIANLGGTTKGVVTDWANSFTSVNPTMSFAVDTSALKYYSSDSFAQSVSADVAAHSTVTATGFKEGMEEFYREYIEPTLSQMADDMRRQADKQEQTVVQIGNRVVNDAVTTQKKANGYVFAR